MPLLPSEDQKSQLLDHLCSAALRSCVAPPTFAASTLAIATATIATSTLTVATATIATTDCRTDNLHGVEDISRRKPPKVPKPFLPEQRMELWMSSGRPIDVNVR